MHAMQANIKKIGKNIENAIHRRGYSSIYDFWVNNPKSAKSTLHDIVSGKSDPKNFDSHSAIREFKNKPFGTDKALTFKLYLQNFLPRNGQYFDQVF